MNYPVAEIIRQLLIDEGHGVVFNRLETPANKAWSVFISREPDTPDKCITIFDTAGILQGRLHDSGEVQEQFGFLVRLRSDDSRLGTNKLREIVEFLDEDIGSKEVVVTDATGTSTTTYTIGDASRRSAIIPLNVDEDNSSRYLFTVNYTINFV